MSFDNFPDRIGVWRLGDGGLSMAPRDTLGDCVYVRGDIDLAADHADALAALELAEARTRKAEVERDALRAETTTLGSAL